MNWKKAWQQPSFRTRLIAGLFILPVILLFFSYFFGIIEKRNGIQLNDWVLNALPAYDLSIPIFAIIWLMTIFIIVRCVLPYLFFFSGAISFYVFQESLLSACCLWLLPSD